MIPALWSFPALILSFEKLNERALDDPRVEVVNEDGYKYVEQTGRTFDLIISDLPDPNHEGLTKLYSVQFYNLLASRLNPQGILSVQSTSPFFAQGCILVYS